MGEFQHRHWCGMIEAVDDYLGGRIDLGRLVGALEGRLDASELKDEKLKEEFRDNWAPFEIEFATAEEMGTPIDVAQMKIAAERMRAFLVRTLDDVMAYHPRNY